MANASSKRIATTNEAALKSLRNGLIIVNLLAPLLRFILSLFTSRTVVPRAVPLLLYVLTAGATVFVWRWFTTIGSPRTTRDGKLHSGDDLGGKGVVEFAWDFVYVTWLCTIGSALFGDWMWWFFALVPGFGAWKLWGLVSPILGMFMPGLFGPRSPKDPAAPADAKEPGESRKQAKLRARAEKGDKRVQQVQTRR